jgi:hypothetical protein
MVKIVNRMGDVKIGKQGEVVYQRHYGQQTRRLVSPKRAIESEAQIAHRQLYRDALTWRKGLSRPNRRYLEGYCIANGVVDSYHIPLPWHRFALKCYLEHIHFVLSDVQATEAEESATKYESYEVAGNAFAYYWFGYISGMTFTPLVAHNLTRVVLKMHRKGSPPLCRIKVFLCDGAHKPTGSVLTEVEVDLSGVTTDPAGENVAIDLPPYPVGLGLEYAITLWHLDGGENDVVGWRYDNVGATYPRGMMVYSTNYGSTWAAWPTVDAIFQEWEVVSIPASKEGTLHVKHPALLSVVQKRGELTVNNYENLSSLDEEYLTKQVGLDVVVGDIIKATTIAGIEYGYTIH